MIDRFIYPVLPDMQEVAQYLETSFACGHLSNFGPANARFTQRLETYLDLPEGRRLVTTSSGHTALMAAYAVLGAQRVVMPAFTFESTRCAATLQGIRTRLVDVDPRTGCLSLETLAAIPLGSYDTVTYVCALSTVTPELFAIDKYCREHGKNLVVDGAATFGTPGIYGCGDAFCLSFHATKTLPIGEGGAIILREHHASAAQAFLNFGRGPDRRPFVHRGIPMVGINGKLSEYAAAVGLSVFEDVVLSLETRRRNSDQYRRLLGERLPPSLEGTVYAFQPTFSPRASRVRMALAEAGIAHLAYYEPLLPLPVSRSLYAQSVCLPVHAGVSPIEIDQITQVYLKGEEG